MANVIDAFGQILSNVDLDTIGSIVLIVKNTLLTINQGISVADKIKKLCKK